MMRKSPRFSLIRDSDPTFSSSARSVGAAHPSSKSSPVRHASRSLAKSGNSLSSCALATRRHRRYPGYLRSAGGGCCRIWPHCRRGFFWRWDCFARGVIRKASSNSNREQALFAGIWGTSILTASVSLSEGTWMGTVSQLAFGCAVGLVMAAGIYVFLRDCWARWQVNQAVEARIPRAQGGRTRLSNRSILRPGRNRGERALLREVPGLPLQGSNVSSLAIASR